MLVHGVNKRETINGAEYFAQIEIGNKYVYFTVYAKGTAEKRFSILKNDNFDSSDDLSTMLAKIVDKGHFIDEEVL